MDVAKTEDRPLSPTGSAERVDLTYRIMVGGIGFAEVDTRTTFDGGRYAVEAVARTTGAFDLLLKLRLWSRVDGALGPRGTVAGARAHRFEARYHTRATRLQSVDVAFGDDGPSRIVTEPPEPPVEAPDFLTGALDPATVSLLAAQPELIDRRLRGNIRMFDGRKRFDVALDHQGPETLAAERRPFYAGEAVRCVIRYRRIRKPSPAWDRARDRNYPKALEAWFASFPDLPRPVPVKACFHTRFGEAVAQLVARDITRAEGLAPLPADPIA
ncbi:DUF3108 domain-containing protein [Zavarzinia compransoris]|uniref:DUF3108 domain-containing protein n=1 Tax=Zavarzinia marina TaxID=2911065 RepID=UPI001F32440C|nr:DUF3108 domain-containing protein [Zavarzinia marina]MCF4164225.1 DUF3108 domain-containing protein [Zavarzinia marina]